MSNALNISVSNTTYQANLSSSNDIDWYAMSIPTNHGIMIEMIHGSSTDFDMWLYDSSGNQIDIAFTGFQPENVESNGTNVGGTTVYLQVDDWASSPAPGWYNFTLQLFSTTGLPSYNQNDAGTGGDASNDYNNPTFVNMTTVPGNNSFNGWGSNSDDAIDEYETYVPSGHGLAVYAWFNSSSMDITLTMAELSSGTNIISQSLSSNPEYVTSNGTYVGEMNILIEVYVTSGEGDYGMAWWIFDLDSDGDGHWDMNETDCGSDPDDINSVPLDTDSDGICDPLDADDDNDGYEDSNDSFELDPSEWEDTDNDNIGNNADSDDDGDGFSDNDEIACGSDPLDGWNQPSDFDSDGICDLQDSDDDNDGYDDEIDVFPMDDSEWADTDNNGVGDNSDTDDDGDGYSDNLESSCDSDPLDSFNVPSDLDMDGTCDLMDNDMDGDNYPNDNDAFPTDSQEWLDTDNDGFGNNMDIDDDGDSVSDNYDAFPLDFNEWADNDNDGLGDNGDPDDDNDGWSDSDETSCSTNSLSSQSVPSDFDEDMVCDIVDTDDDGDGVLDENDAFPMDNAEWEDTDSDGIGNNFDDDDDGDAWFDIYEPNCGTDPLDGASIPLDFDADWVCDLVDDDDDNDGVTDVDDPFPKNPDESLDTDSDGIGNNADNDDDNDGWTDNTESLCFTSSLSSNSVPEDTDGDKTCDVNDPDIDGDNIVNELDAFPLDGSEWTDRNNDGKGDNAYPLSITDKMSLNPIPTFLILLTIMALIGGAILVYTNQQKSTKSNLHKGTDMTSYMENETYSDENLDSEEIIDEISEQSEPISLESEISTEKEIETEAVVTNIPPPPPGFAPDMGSVPPPPPGFGPPSTAKSNEIVSSWESLPPGGEYTETDPLRYSGLGIGTWEERDDESWEKISE